MTPFCNEFIEVPFSEWAGGYCKLRAGHDGDCSPVYPVSSPAATEVTLRVIAMMDPRIAAEIDRQDAVSTYGTDRDGVRVALAYLQDELDETLEAYEAEKRPLEGRTWERTQEEAVQVAALAVRLVRDLRRAQEEGAQR